MKTIYSKFFNLELNPFGETPDPDFYYDSHQHNCAITSLQASHRQGKGFCLLTGEVGTGKTLISRLFISSITSQTNTALILYPKFNEIELLQAIIEEFEIPANGIELKTTKNYIDHLNYFLLGNLEHGRKSVLVIDEAQAMSVEALEMIRLLTNLETKTQKLLQIVLIGQPELLETLDRPELRQLKQRIASQATLQGLDIVETERYIKSRIELVGNGNFIRFDPSAIKIIHALSAGMPRRINQLCERILTAAEAKRVRLINAELTNAALGIKSKSMFSIFSKKERA